MFNASVDPVVTNYPDLLCLKPFLLALKGTPQINDALSFFSALENAYEDFHFLFKLKRKVLPKNAPGKPNIFILLY